MNKLFLLTLGSLLLFSCREKQEAADTGELNRTADLESQVAQLKMENEMKDSVINEALSFYNEIQANLESIGAKKDEIGRRSQDPELTEYDREYILSEIRHINFLREENAKRVRQLNDQLKQSGVKMQEMESMVNRLVGEIQAKDEQIEMLQQSLDNLDKEYARLFDAYQEQNLVVNEMRDELNTAYYTYGTVKELENNGVIEQKNGFIGIGKRTTIASQLNQDYFTKIDLTQKTEIFVEGTDIRLVSDHPSSSYEIVQQGKNSRIKIRSPREFWKISRFLIVVIE